MPDSRHTARASGYRATLSRLGELLLTDALTRKRRIVPEAGGIGLFIDAIDDEAASYYRRFGFVHTPDNPLLLFLAIHDQTNLTKPA